MLSEFQSKHVYSDRERSRYAIDLNYISYAVHMHSLYVYMFW